MHWIRLFGTCGYEVESLTNCFLYALCWVGFGHGQSLKLSNCVGIIPYKIFYFDFSASFAFSKSPNVPRVEEPSFLLFLKSFTRLASAF